MSGQPSRHAPAPLLNSRFEELGLAHGMVNLDPFVDPHRISYVFRIGLAGVIAGARRTAKSQDDAHNRTIDDR